MTARQLQKEFEQAAYHIDAVKKNEVILITDTIQYFLNESQNTFIKTRLNNISKSTGNKQKQLDEIRTLIIKSQSLNENTSLSSQTFKVYDLPFNYNFLIADRTTTNYCNVLRTYQNRLLSSENIQEALYGTHTKPKHNSPISEIYGNYLRIYRDFDLTFTINDVNIDYIRDWQEINLMTGITSELDESVHKDIIQLAVNIFLEAIESGRFKTNIEKNIITEQI
jgi:hypothetical protein